MILYEKMHYIDIKLDLVKWKKNNLYKYTSSNFSKGKLIHSQFVGHKLEVSYPPRENVSKLMLTIG